MRIPVRTHNCLQVGIIPTDTLPALVCDIADKAAVQRLYELKGARPSKRLSILCRKFTDISKYTLGFPVSNVPGQPNFYKIAKQILPGPYTLVLVASKELPKQITNFVSGKSKHRSSVGVRIPNDPICQAVLERLDRPLLCSSVKLEEEEDDRAGEAPDAAVLADIYGPRGLAFVVDAGPRGAEDSSVVDLTGGEPEILRQGKGDLSFL
jgi:tRNA threonylcarbamoyl adenosine modification protein (Sua5/YciO/YrdC/YwlC family)